VYINPALMCALPFVALANLRYVNVLNNNNNNAVGKTYVRDTQLVHCPSVSVYMHVFMPGPMHSLTCLLSACSILKTENVLLVRNDACSKVDSWSLLYFYTEN